MDFSGRHVVITGASSGIGRATAVKVARGGGKVTVIARRAEALEALQHELGDLIHCEPGDVGDKAAMLAALDGAVAAHGPIDGLFLNAADAGSFVPPWDYGDKELEEVMRVNVLSPFWAIRHVLPAMVERGHGSIVVTGSLSSERGMAGNMGYVVSKHALLGLARSIAAEVATTGVRCNCINPGFIDTPIMDEVPDAARSVMTSRSPQKRMGTSEEVAAVAAFLLSDESTHVTAQSWAIDGGLLGTLIF
jgi:NAD(P)-dependent dehydrogenase (short-subunit alcohol dehydrogenase family)